MKTSANQRGKRNGKAKNGKVRGTRRPTIASGAKQVEKDRTGASPALLAQMEQQRTLLEIQNEELARAHAALEISHQRFAELHEQAPVGYLTFDAQGCIREINAEAERLLCTRRAIVIGKPFIVYVAQAERRKFLAHLWKMSRATSTVATDLRIAAQNGTIRQVRMSTSRHRDARGHSSLFLAAIEDVTELRAASANAASGRPRNCLVTGGGRRSAESWGC
jgi:PAS domain S-box-containing protein